MLIFELLIIGLLVNVYDDDFKKGFVSGMNGYLIKLIDVDKLFKILW